MITEEQRKARQARLGASDAPILLGLSPFSTILDLYESKVLGKYKPPTPQMIAGSFLERGILDWAESELGYGLDRSVCMEYKDDPLFIANLDGWNDEHKVVVECKLVSEYMSSHWKAGPPDYVIAQITQQYFVTEAKQAVCVACIIRNGSPSLKLWEVPYFGDLATKIKVLGRKFWDEHVVPQIPPSLLDPSVPEWSGARRSKSQSESHMLGPFPEEAGSQSAIPEEWRSQAETTDEQKHPLLSHAH